MCQGDAENPGGTWNQLHDSLNLRCYRQQQRFGFDLLYPTDRYVTGLTKPILTLPSDPAKTVLNPLFAGRDGKLGRDPSLVFLAGIVGVPWQDIATEESLSSPVVMRYLSASELVERDRWPLLVGQATASPPTPPTDPFMIESIEPRQGTNPIVAFPIAPANSTNPQANAINGHEQQVPNSDDLQYACTFRLTTPRECLAGDSLCDCAPARDGNIDALLASNSPLCQPPGGGAPGTTQYLAKAYPGARQLTVLKNFGWNAIVASICPKFTTATGSPSGDPNYGYNPAIGALLDRLKEALRGKCLARRITTIPDENGALEPAIDCNVIEVQAASDCDCSQPGRSPAPSKVIPAVFNQLEASGQCGGPGQVKCDATNFCLCDIHQETGTELSHCVANQPTKTPGFCYIEDSSSPALQHCPQNQQQVLRFIEPDGAKLPAEGAFVFLACDGSSTAP
jgi:hypothetical protein